MVLDFPSGELRGRSGHNLQVHTDDPVGINRVVRFCGGDIHYNIVGLPISQEWDERCKVDVMRRQIKRLERASRFSQKQWTGRTAYDGIGL